MSNNSHVVIRSNRIKRATDNMADGVDKELGDKAEDIKSKANANKPRRVESGTIERKGSEILIGWGSVHTFWASFVEFGTVFQPAKPFVTPASETGIAAIKRALNNLERFAR